MGNRQFTLLTYETSKDERWSLHRPGCSDIRRDLGKHGGYAETIEAADAKAAVEAALADINADFIAEGSTGFGPEAVRVLPCTKDAK